MFSTKIFKSLLALFFAFILIMLSTLVLLSTDSGTRLLWPVITRVVPGSLFAAKIQGNLSDGLNITHLSYSSSDFSITSSEASLKLNLWQLLIGKIDIDHLTSNHLTIHFKKQQQTTSQPNWQPTSLLQSPLSINFKQVQLNDINITGLNQDIVINQIYLHGLMSKQQNQIFLQSNITVPISLNINFNLVGDIDHYQSSLHLTNNSMNWLLQGEGNQKTITIHTPRAELLQGKLDINGKLNWQPKFTWDLRITANHLDLKTITSEILQPISFIAQLRGNQLQSNIDISDINTKLENQNLHGYAHAVIQNQKLQAVNINLQAGQATLQSHGQLGDVWNLQWDIFIPDLGQLFAESSGYLSSTGTITGTFSQPIINSEININRLKFKQYQIKTLHGNLQLSPTKTSNANLTAQQIKLGAFIFQQANILGEGTFANHQLSANLQFNPQNNLQIKMQGSLKSKTWEGIISIFNLDSKPLGNWRLANPIKIILSKLTSQLQNFCWLSNDSQICAQAQWQQQELQSAQFSIKHFSLTKLNFLLAPKIRLQSELNAEGHLLTKQGQNTGGLNARLNAGQIVLASDNQKQTIPIKNGSLNINLSKTGLDSHLQLTIPPFKPLNLHIQLPGYQGLQIPDTDQPVQAELNWQITELAPLKFLIPQISNPKGIISINYHAGGTLRNPKFSGTLQLQNASLGVPSLAILLNNTNLKILANGQQFIFNGQTQSGQGVLKINGQTNINDKNIKTNLNINGNQFLACNTAELQLITSPRLNLEQNGKLISINGKVFIPHAIIKPLDFSQVVTLPDDVVFVRAKKRSTVSPIHILTTIELIPEKDVQLLAGGLTSHIGGRLSIHDDSQSITTASGYLTLLNGVYNIYGQKLSITQGQLIYTNSPIDNPAINLRAVQTMKVAPNQQSFSQTQNLTVGVAAQGTLKKPKITLFSEPAGMSQADILSMLVLGQPASNATGANAQLLMRAAQALSPNSGAGIGHLTQQLQQSLGLSQLGFESEATVDPNTKALSQNTALVLGKYLSPRLYISYSLGLLEQLNILRLRYSLTEHWAIQTQSSNLGTGADILYSIEKK